MKLILAAAAVCAASVCSNSAATASDVPACAQITNVHASRSWHHRNGSALFLYAETVGSGVCPGVVFQWGIYDHEGHGWAWHKAPAIVAGHRGGTGMVRLYRGNYGFESGWVCAVAYDQQTKQILSSWGYDDPNDPLHSECDGFYLPPPNG